MNDMDRSISRRLAVIFVLSVIAMGSPAAVRAQAPSEPASCEDVHELFFVGERRDAAVDLILARLQESAYEYDQRCLEMYLEIFESDAMRQGTAEFEDWLQVLFRQQSRERIDAIVEHFQGDELAAAALSARTEYLTVHSAEIVPRQRRIEIGDAVAFQIRAYNLFEEQIAGPERTIRSTKDFRVEADPPDLCAIEESTIRPLLPGQVKLVVYDEFDHALTSTAIEILPKLQLSFEGPLQRVAVGNRRQIRVRTNEGQSFHPGEQLVFRAEPDSVLELHPLPVAAGAEHAVVEVAALRRYEGDVALHVHRSDGAGATTTLVRVKADVMRFAESSYTMDEGGAGTLELVLDEEFDTRAETIDIVVDPPQAATVYQHPVSPQARRRKVEVDDLRWGADGTVTVSARTSSGVETSTTLVLHPQQPSKHRVLLALAGTGALAWLTWNRGQAVEATYAEGMDLRRQGAGADVLDPINADIARLEAQRWWSGFGTVAVFGLFIHYVVEYQRDDSEFRRKEKSRFPSVTVTPRGELAMTIRF